MASIKLKHSGGNGTIIAAPTSNPSSDKTLTLPSDVDGTVVSKDSSNSLQNITGVNGGQLGNRNKIINGAMQIAQRGTSFTSVTSSAYHLDRFYLYLQNTSAAFTATQSTDSPDGFANSYKLDVTTADTSIASNEEIRLQYKLEGFDVQRFAKGTSAAKKFTLSFYVKTTKTGVYCVELYDRDNNRDVSGSYTVSDTNWNRYTIDFPADTTGAFGNDNGSSLEITWWLVAGSAVQGGSLNTAWRSSTDPSSATGQVNFTDSTSNDWYLTGVQLEATDTGTATDFEHRSFGQELELCRRYFQVVVDDGSGKSFGNGTCYTASNMHLILQLCPNMRATPTIDQTTGSDYYRMFRSGAEDTFDQFSLEGSSSERMVDLYATGATGVQGASALLRTDNAAAKIRLSAEL